MNPLEQLIADIEDSVLAKPNPSDLLTVRLLAQGVSRDEIARRQQLARKSVDDRVYRLHRRYDTHSTAALVGLCVKRGWIRAEDL